MPVQSNGEKNLWRGCQVHPPPLGIQEGLKYCLIFFTRLEVLDKLLESQTQEDELNYYQYFKGLISQYIFYEIIEFSYYVCVCVCVRGEGGGDLH